jgi:cell division protein YceG involved in septum cleavage
MNFLRIEYPDQFLSQFNSKNKIQVIVFVCAIFLITLLGFKLFNIEHNNTNYDILLNETRDKIRLISSEIGSIDKKISKEKAQDDEIKTELFSKLSKRVKSLERLLQDGDSHLLESLKKPKE